jgi:stage II sporulation protein R
MKRIVYYALVMLVATLVLAGMPTDAEAEIYEDTIRLHILANSDSKEDQALKIKIRDKLLIEYGEDLKKFGTKDEAEVKIKELLPEIERSAEEWIRELGYDYDVEAEIGVEWYETRDYGDFSLPCGYYTSLRVLIGSGEGQNWWCVMYPPLCTELATEDAPGDDGIIDYTKEELLLINSGKYQVKFKILEELSRTFAKNS